VRAERDICHTRSHMGLEHRFSELCDEGVMLLECVSAQ